jgi:peptidoglycan hydrolase-like protein with peptidoglycan-binding domain
MKTIALLPLALLLLGSPLFADEQLRNVQTELKSLGFYYGDVTGQANAETTAALRRYQIRNGLEVTGSLNDETLAAIGIGPKKSAAPKAPVAKAPPVMPAPVEKAVPPVNLRRDPSAEESDRDFLRREEGAVRVPDAGAPFAPDQRDPSVLEPPQPLDAPSADFPVLFAGTPYAEASLSVQQQTLRRAQSVLASRGFYRDIVDGLPGPATEEALLSYQRNQRLTMTGRLDLETLGQLRLLPGPSTYSDANPREPKRVYRGIWINKGGLRFGLEFD